MAPTGSVRPTLKDIAVRAGISESAASFALSGKPGVSAQTRAKVLKLAEEMEWVPNHAAKSLAGARSETVGLVISRRIEDVGSEAFFLRLLTGIQAALSTRGYGLLLQSVGSVEEEMRTYVRWSAAARVDAVILIDLSIDDPRPAKIVELGLPAVITGGPDPEHLVPAVSIDDSKAMEQIIEYLFSQGHRCLGYVSGKTSFLHINQRVESFRAVTSLRGGIPLVGKTDFSPDSATHATAELAESSPRPTVLIYDNEVMALAGIAELRRRGFDIPRDVSVIVWEDSPVVAMVEPPLTALQRDAFQLGSEVATKVLRILDGDSVADESRSIPTLVVRNSVESISQ